MEVTRGAAPGELLVRDGERLERVYAIVDGDTTWVFHDGAVHEIVSGTRGRRIAAHQHGALTAPMPATVVAVNVKPGDEVGKGQILVVLEAMKMELPIRASGDGKVAAVHCSPGDLVQPNVSLVDLE
jgi:biotin carboxyl carrier protein